MCYSVYLYLKQRIKGMKGIKKILSSKGMTQIMLAKKLNVKPETLSRTINGNPTIKSLNEIANALNVEVVDLFNSREPKGFIEYNDNIYVIKRVTDLEDLLYQIKSEYSKTK